MAPPTTHTFRTAVVETPFRSADIQIGADLQKYLARVMRACFDAGLSPYASHHTIPWLLAASAGSQIDTADRDPTLRERGIAAGYAWAGKADEVVFGIDWGWSDGMRRALERVIELRGPTFEVLIYSEDPSKPSWTLTPAPAIEVRTHRCVGAPDGA